MLHRTLVFFRYWNGHRQTRRKRGKKKLNNLITRRENNENKNSSFRGNRARGVGAWFFPLIFIPSSPFDRCACSFRASAYGELHSNSGNKAIRVERVRRSKLENLMAYRERWYRTTWNATRNILPRLSLSVRAERRYRNGKNDNREKLKNREPAVCIRGLNGREYCYIKNLEVHIFHSRTTNRKTWNKKYTDILRCNRKYVYLFIALAADITTIIPIHWRERKFRNNSVIWNCTSSVSSVDDISIVIKGLQEKLYRCSRKMEIYQRSILFPPISHQLRITKRLGSKIHRRTIYTGIS